MLQIKSIRLTLVAFAIAAHSQILYVIVLYLCLNPSYAVAVLFHEVGLDVVRHLQFLGGAQLRVFATREVDYGQDNYSISQIQHSKQIIKS